ncbi:hypothetical protein FGO68_gene12419 [Halteria grandinella]|uniref:Uncharacterized protein n=1 Tax=Halteria grandinella TaxID=5974 RepID=A0A8J8NCW9_HALGN|nr:hypothetical protein FGO68_gene12419 [Halteria grandinella]
MRLSRDCKIFLRSLSSMERHLRFLLVNIHLREVLIIFKSSIQAWLSQCCCILLSYLSTLIPHLPLRFDLWQHRRVSAKQPSFIVKSYLCKNVGLLRQWVSCESNLPLWCRWKECICPQESELVKRLSVGICVH